jgi:hypothetical protein
MENQPIIFGRDITTNAITQIRTVGNTLLTTGGTLNDISGVNISGALFNGDLLRYDSTVNQWRNRNTQYLTFVMYGRTSPTVYATNTDKLIIQSSASHWTGTIPDPQDDINGYYSATNNAQGGNILFNSTTGVFTIDPNKTYVAMATLNLNGSNINTPTNYEMGFVDFTSGSKNNFFPDARTVFTQQVDNAGVGATLSYPMANCSAFSFVLRIVTAQTVATQGTDCNISITLIQI